MSWKDFLPTVRVGGALPLTFRLDGEHVAVEMVVPYVPPIRPTPSEADLRSFPLSIADGFTVTVTARFKLPDYHADGAAEFVRGIARAIYHHEIDEQLRVGDRRPFAPDHE